LAAKCLQGGTLQKKDLFDNHWSNGFTFTLEKALIHGLASIVVNQPVSQVHTSQLLRPLVILYNNIVNSIIIRLLTVEEV